MRPAAWPAIVFSVVAFGPGARTRSLPAMVHIPAGCFDFGPRDEPIRVITRSTCVKEFLIDRSEVTVGEYKKCIRAGACSAPKLPPKTKQQRAQQAPNYPVVGLFWWQARDYCRWVGKRLPTFDEWERAARGPKLTLYPWGESAPTSQRVSFLNLNELALGLRPVCSKPLGNSPEGICDMVDNAWEYLGSGVLAGDGMEFQIIVIESPKDEEKTAKMVMGKVGTEYIRPAWEYSVTADEDEFPAGYIGFRCASDVPQPAPPR